MKTFQQFIEETDPAKKSVGKKKLSKFVTTYANTNSSRYSKSQTDRNSLTGRGGSGVRTHDKDWDE